MGLKNRIIKVRSAKNLRCYVVLSFHFTENHKWGQNLLLLRIIIQSPVLGLPLVDQRWDKTQEGSWLPFSCSFCHTDLSWSSSHYLLKLSVRCHFIWPIYTLCFIVNLKISKSHRCTSLCWLLPLSYYYSFLENSVPFTCQSAVYSRWQSTSAQLNPTSTMEISLTAQPWQIYSFWIS